MEFDLCKMDWVAVSAIATFVMVIATFLALRQNKKQLKELKRQWQEEHKARLEFSIDTKYCTFFLKMQNVGKSDAYIKKIEINEEFLNEIPIDCRKKLLNYLCTNSLRIKPSKAKYYVLSEVQRDDLEEFKSIPIIITAIHNSGFIQKEEFTINDYDYIGRSLPVENGIEMELKGIKEYLKIIKEKMNKYQEN